jgi:hypothetical protein
MEEIKIKEIADKFFEEQEKLNISYDSREAFIEGYKLAKEMEKEQIKKERVEAYNNGYANGQNDAYAI